MMGSTCPYCGAETRPGDNFCLNCGNRLLPATPSSQQQAQPNVGESTLPAQDGWASSKQDQDSPQVTSGTNWSDSAAPTMASSSAEPPTSLGSPASHSVGQATSTASATIERPARFILHADNGSDMPTIAVQYNPDQEMTYRTQEDESMTSGAGDDFSTKSMGNGTSEAVQPAVAEASAPYAPPSEEASTPSLAPAYVSASPAFESGTTSSAASHASPASSPSSAAHDMGVSFNSLTSIPQPTLPDIAPLMAALSTLDGQVMSLQEQLNATQEAVRNHEAEVAQATSQLRSGVRRVSDRMDNTIADVARSREALSWTELIQLMEDVQNNPRDIEYVTKLARKARELNKVFQLHQNVLNTLAECNSLLRGLIGEDR